jgi:hypothetical protein
MLLAFVVKNLTDDFMIRTTSKEFWALNAMLIGYGIRRARIALKLSGSDADGTSRDRGRTIQQQR